MNKVFVRDVYNLSGTSIIHQGCLQAVRVLLSPGLCSWSRPAQSRAVFITSMLTLSSVHTWDNAFALPNWPVSGLGAVPQPPPSHAPLRHLPPVGPVRCVKIALLRETTPFHQTAVGQRLCRHLPGGMYIQNWRSRYYDTKVLGLPPLFATILW